MTVNKNIQETSKEEGRIRVPEAVKEGSWEDQTTLMECCATIVKKEVIWRESVTNQREQKGVTDAKKKGIL